jgi:hypothetical protein
MPVIQKHARSWKEGTVSSLQKIAKDNALAIVAGISIQAEISNEFIADVRNRVPAFAHRRSELYKVD